MSSSTVKQAAKTGGNRFLRTVSAISTLAGWAAAAMILSSVLITCQMLFIRRVLNGSTIWQTEAVVYLIMSATLIGLPYVQRERGHVSVDLIPLMLSARPRFVLACVTLIASIIVSALMLWYGFELWHFAWDKGWKSDTVWGVPLWIPYLSIPLGFGLLCLQLLADFIALILKIDAPFGLEQA